MDREVVVKAEHEEQDEAADEERREKTPTPMADFDRPSSPSENREGSPDPDRSRQHKHPRKGAGPNDNEQVRVSSEFLGLFRDSHAVTGIAPTEWYSYGLYVPEAARSSEERRALFSVGGAVLGPGIRQSLLLPPTPSPS
jgi:hypothetical protein